jgi:protein O-GlcNAc transferase
MTSPAPPPAAADPLLAARSPLAAGDFATAGALLLRAVHDRPDDPRAWGLLARCRRLSDDLEGAELALQRALALAPAFFPLLREQAALLAAQGRIDDAAAQFEQLIAAQPGDPSLLWDYALVTAPLAPARALPALVALRRSRPDDLPPLLLLGQVQRALGDTAAAQTHFADALARAPDAAEALEGLYWCAVDRGEADAERVELAARVATAGPTPGRWLRLAQEHLRLGDYPAAHAARGQALAQDDGFLPAHWAGMCWPPTIAPADAAASHAFAASFSSGLDRFTAIDWSTPEAAAQAWECVGQSTAFHCHYFGSETPEQSRFGDLVARMVEPSLPPTEPRPLRRGRRRVAVVSAHLRTHTVARLFGPLFEALGGAFDLHTVALEPPSPEWRARLAAVGTVHSGAATAREWRDRIAALQADVLIYPEVGMDALTQALAATRLAPVQLALWGHPVTTGLPSIDWMLSPDAMEPPDAERHYRERLLRLPGLGHGLKPEAQPAPILPWTPGDDGDVDLLCAQTVYKLLPAMDTLFGRILTARPRARLHLLGDDRPAVRDWLRARMAPTLAAAGADPDRQLSIHGFLPLPQYLGLAQACRLNLASVGWSGGMSSLDLLTHGLPTLALPGATMRSRQAAAMLQRLDLSELIASDEDDYVDRAIALIDAPQRLVALRDALLDRRERLYADGRTEEALVRFIAEIEAA